MSWPFRFYGAAPADWAEGANAGHALTVCFEEAPSEGALRQLGACWASSTNGTRIDPVSAACSSRVLRLVFGETEQGASGDHLDVQASFLRRAHEISPVHDAVYDNARDGSDAWSAWSLEYGPPAPRPADYAASPAFDSGFRSAYVTPEAPVAPAAPVAPSSSTTRAPAPSADIAARLSTAPSALQSKHKGSHVVGDDDCHLIAKKKGDRHTTLMLVRGSKRTSLTKVVAPHLVETILGVALAPGGERGFVRTHGRLVEVTPEPSARVIATSAPGRPVFDIATPTDSCVLWVDGSTLHRLDLIDGEWTETAQLPAEEVRYILDATPDQAVLLAFDPIHRKRRFPHPTRRVDLRGGGLSLTGAYDLLAMRATWDGERFIVADDRRGFHWLG